MSTLTVPSREVLSQQGALAEATAWKPRGQYSPHRLAEMREATRLFAAATSGSLRARADFQESMSRSDFQFLFGNVLDKELMERYPSVPKVWTEFATRTTVPDFKAKKWVDLLGGRARLSAVPELTEYPMRKVTDAEYSLTVSKYGDQFGISWESFVNDDLGALRELPDDLAIAASESEDIAATELLIEATGPRAAFFSVGNGNKLAGNTALTTDSLQAALTHVSVRRDSDNRPVIVTAYVLMVPPALEVAAMKVVNAETIEITQGSNKLIMGNWLRGKVKVVVNPWIPTIDVSANVATTWYLLPDPKTRRPAAVLGFLRGHETPDLRIRSNTGTRVDGGPVPAEEGSFEVDDIRYRVRHIMGGTTLDPIATVVSNGSGV